MGISKIKIQNYKSIKDIELETGNLLTLVGANSAGKSNILKAINFILGERYPMPQSLNKKDFYNENFENNILIEITFDEEFESYGEPCSSIVFKTIYNSLRKDFDVELKAVNAISELPQRWRLKGDVRESFPVVYIPASRNFNYHLKNTSEWSFLGKIIKQFNNKFPEDKIEDLENKFKEVKEILEIDEFKEFEKCFRESFEDHVIPLENEINLEFKPFNPKSYYKTIEIIPSEFEYTKDLDQMGDGMKNLILLSLFRAYAGTFPKSTIFLIEEPEIYLHPQAREDLYNIFKRLDGEGSQIFYTTHSQEFIDIEDFENICRVKKVCGSGDYYTSVIQLKSESFLRTWRAITGITDATLESIKLFLKNLSNSETNKAFFSKKIVLVEGNTEKWLFPIYFKKEDYDTSKNNIEFVSVGGKNNMEKFILLFQGFDYPVYPIFDIDKTKGKGGEINKKLTKNLTGYEKEFPKTEINDRTTFFEEDIETELKDEISDYSLLEAEARLLYGLRPNGCKQVVAKYIANKTEAPIFVKEIIKKIKDLI